MAGSDEVCDAAFKQAGIIRCNNLDEMFNRAIAFAYQPVPKTNRVAIITNAGGPGVLTTDAVIKKGLRMAKFSDETTKILKKSLPSTANIKNPIDVIGDARADRYNVAMSATFKDDNVDAVFVILTPQSMTEIDLIAREVAKVSSHYDKPVYASFMGEADVSVGIEVLQRNRIPHYQLPESMADSLSCVFQFHNDLSKVTSSVDFSDVNKEKAHAILDAALKNNRDYLPEDEASQVLRAYGLQMHAKYVATTPEEIPAVAKKTGYPLVMKVISDDVVHKFDVGGIVLNITSETEAQEAFVSITNSVKKHMPNAVIKGVLVTKMIPEGEEVILGIKRDPSFGPVIMFGLGGLYVEIFRDVSFRVAPVSPEEVTTMMEQIIAYPILNGARGRQLRDINSIKDCILRLSKLALDCPQIQELDINPLIVLNENEGSFVADAKIML